MELANGERVSVDVIPGAVGRVAAERARGRGAGEEGGEGGGKREGGEVGGKREGGEGGGKREGGEEGEGDNVKRKEEDMESARNGEFRNYCLANV